MNEETVVPPSKEEVSASAVVQSGVEKNKLVTTNVEPSEPKKQVVKNTAVKKVTAEPDVVKKVSAEKPVQAPTVPVKHVKKIETAPKSLIVNAPQAAKTVKEKKPPLKKPKLVRDSFTIPESDYALFASLKQRALVAGIEVKKSELLRASLVMLAKVTDAELVKAIGLVERIKTGRPKK